MTVQVPTHPELEKAIAVAESVGLGDLFGKGTLEDPLFPIRVDLDIERAHAYAITAALEQVVKRYLRTRQVERRHAEPIRAAIRRELWGSTSHAEFKTRARCLVSVGKLSSQS